MLAGPHFGGSARSFGDPCVVERLDGFVLPEGARLFHCRLPELETPIQARTGAAPGELLSARKARVVLREQFRAEGIDDRLVVVEATVEALHVRGRQQAQQIFVEIRADEQSAPLREAGVAE